MFNFFYKIKSPKSIDSKVGQEGIALYLAIAALSIVLAIALGVSLLSVYQLKSLNEAGNSVVAFAAAETGIEWALFPRYEGSGIDETNYMEWNKCPLTDGQFVCVSNRDLGNGARFTVTAATYPDSPSCPADFICIKSVGKYKGTERVLRIQM